MVTSNDICPKCGGKILTNYTERTCINCGNSPMTPEERHTFYKAHEQEMIKDLDVLDPPALIKKWSIPVQIISHLKSAGTKRHYSKRSKSVKTPREPISRPKADDPRIFITITNSDLVTLSETDQGLAFNLYRIIYLARLDKEKRG